MQLFCPLLGFLACSTAALAALNSAPLLSTADPLAWQPMGGSPPAALKTVAGKQAFHFRCPFSTATLERASWDQQVQLDLSSGRGVAFDMLCADASPVSYFSIYFQSGAGWYHGAFFPEEGSGWQTIRIDKSEMTSEGSPAGWGKVNAIRVSAWCGQDRSTEFYLAGLRQTGLLGADAAIAILRAESVLRERASEGRNAGQFAENISRFLRELEVGCATLSDLDATPERLAKAKIVILPFNPSLPTATADALHDYVSNGGKLLAFYTVPEQLRPALRVRNGKHLRARPGEFSRIRFRKGALDGAPAEIAQSSWNINAFEPIPGQSETIAEWLDQDGRSTGRPCLIASSNTIVMTHVLLTDDAANKRQALLAMLGKLEPSIWHEAATAALSRIGQLASFRSSDEAISAIAALGVGNTKVSASLARVGEYRRDAESLLRRGNYAESVQTAEQARAELSRAFCLAQKPEPGEFRAFWCHSAFGVQGLTWEEAVSRLAENGFTAVFPNMLWGGVAFYPSKTLPVAPEVATRGDQLAQCLAAARKHGLQVHVWKVNWNTGHAAPREFLGRLRQGGRLQASSAGKEEPWLCPSHPENQQLEIDSMVEVARNYEVDGIHFDYIRYPDADHCFCSGCRERFEASTGRTLAKWPQDVLGQGASRAAWLDWRRSNISRVVMAISKQARAVRPGIKISAAVFPNWESSRDSIGQDWKHWCEAGYLDFVCPMDYTSSNNNFRNMVKRQVTLAGKVPCYPGIGASASASRLGADKVIEQITLTRQFRTGGFIIFNYGAAEANELLPSLGLGISLRR